MRRLIASILVIFCGLSQASTEVRGQLEVTKSCPAYVSKNKKSNPGEVTILPGEEYSIFEINRSENPDWLRVEIPGYEYPLRWISTECGEANYRIIDAKTCDQSPGRADSYVLALSWQPAFCQTYGYEAGKPECANLKSKSYAASHLALHGLWPNQDSCGQNYGFCGVDPKSNHCDYPPLSLNTDVATNLRVFMPSFAYGSCLERHEWNKHGSCQILSTDTYYTLAMRLAKEADLTKFGQYLHNHLGEAVTRTKLEETLKQSFGKTASKKVFLGCKNGYLVDVFIYLPPLIPLQESLESLVSKSVELNRSTGCPATIYISDFTKG